MYMFISKVLQRYLDHNSSKKLAGSDRGDGSDATAAVIGDSVVGGHGDIIGEVRMVSLVVVMVVLLLLEVILEVVVEVGMVLVVG